MLASTDSGAAKRGLVLDVYWRQKKTTVSKLLSMKILYQATGDTAAFDVGMQRGFMFRMWLGGGAKWERRFFFHKFRHLWFNSG